MIGEENPQVFWIVLGTTLPDEIVHLPGTSIAAFKDFDRSQLSSLEDFMAQVAWAIGRNNFDRIKDPTLPYAHQPLTYVIGDWKELGIHTIQLLGLSRVNFCSPEDWVEVLSVLIPCGQNAKEVNS